MALTSCSPDSQVSQGVERWLRWHPALSETQERDMQFEFEVVPLDRGGRYVLRGKTELPDGSQLAIAALRYLKLDPDRIQTVLDIEGESSKAKAFANELDFQQISNLVADFPNDPGEVTIKPSQKKQSDLKPSYGILDYQPVTVQDGAWQTELNLWQVAKDGRYQESWQLHQEKLALEWQAEPDVVFLATLLTDGAADRLQTLQNQLAERQLNLNRSLIQTSPAGEQYFQSVQLLPVGLPQSQTSPPPVRVQDINGGWGERYLLVEQDPLPGTLAFPDQRHRDDPGSPREFIQ